ncbi:MAG: hypothetical protein M1830_000195 [Pleopsidium flavum]|nr:MAG: hypothetical protein M1830_000195 [Pleopsidium flavum]
MGIPHLITYLQPYATANELGNCTSDDRVSAHRARSKVIIDGPGLAYHIYYRQLAWMTKSNNAFDASPSYEDLGKGAVTFLDELQKHNVVIDKIYFDGFLPASKEPIRIARLESYLKQLVTYRSTHSGTFKASETVPVPRPVEVWKLFDDAHPVPIHFSALPASPFLVPAVIEALVHSHYGGITEVVPGEADTFCAIRARTCGGIVLSSDSDLLVGDLGMDGSVSLFRDLTLTGTGDVPKSIRTIIFKPRHIATRLGLDDLQGLAFELSQDSTISFRAAIRRAKQLAQNVSSNALYQDFVSCYSAVGPNQTDLTLHVETMAGKQPADPRVSELVLQNRALTKGKMTSREVEEVQLRPRIYLPFLLDDPSRSSAWLTSSSLRAFTYSLLNLTIEALARPRTIGEYGRRGHRIVPTEVKLLSEDECEAYSKSLIERLQKARSDLGVLSNLDFWRTFGLYELCRWCKENDKATPPQDGLRRLVECENPHHAVLRWEDFHLYAQMQGLLYSLRMLQQIITEVRGAHGVKTMEASVDLLHEQLSELPPLKQLFPSRYQLGTEHRSSSYWRHVMTLMLSLLEEEFAETDATAYDDQEDGIAGHRELQVESSDAYWPIERPAPERKRRRKGTLDRTMVKEIPSDRHNNMYQVLDMS